MVKLNSIINVKIESKKLRLSESKCYKLHIDKRKKKTAKCTVKLLAHDDEIKHVNKLFSFKNDELS